MDEFEDYSEEIFRRRAKLSHRRLSCCVTADRAVDEGLSLVYRELDVDSCLGYNWKKLAGVLLQPPPTAPTIEHLYSSKSPARELLKIWVSQSYVSKNFDSLIETMVECRLYSACDELLDYLEALNLDLDEHYEGEVSALNEFTANDEVNNGSDDANEPNPATSHHINAQERSRSLTDIVSVPIPDSVSNEQSRSRVTGVQRSISLPERSRWLKTLLYPIRKIKNAIKRSLSSPANMSHSSPTLPPPEEPAPPSLPPPPPQNEIFIVSSFADNQTKGMQDLMSFVRRLKVVKTGELTVRTIHDIDQGGLVTTAWLEERVMRARYVIVCFSEEMKNIMQQEPKYCNQTDLNLKFTMEFLVTGTIYDYGCRNPKGKFIPIVLGGYDRSAVVVALRQFQNFCWPDEQERIQKYILNLPEYPPPPQGCPKPLVRKEIC